MTSATAVETFGGFTPRPTRTPWLQRLWRRLAGLPCQGCESRDRKIADLAGQLRAAWAAPPWAPPVTAGAAAIVRALADSDPHFRGHDPQHECSLCGVLGATSPAGHGPACPWRQARLWVEAHDGPGTVAR